MTISHACDTCDPAVGVFEDNPAPGIYVFTCCGCRRELWQEHDPDQRHDPDADQDEDWRGRP